mmetsp:Transcript_2838/g.8379  ORF Transcript_2838/g.8379 Transcript_2838/m.8379 type:complete len:265 (-) Transcript_2838:1280-2074(-)
MRRVLVHRASIMRPRQLGTRPPAVAARDQAVRRGTVLVAVCKRRSQKKFRQRRCTGRIANPEQRPQPLQVPTPDRRQRVVVVRRLVDEHRGQPVLWHPGYEGAAFSDAFWDLKFEFDSRTLNIHSLPRAPAALHLHAVLHDALFRFDFRPLDFEVMDLEVDAAWAVYSRNVAVLRGRRRAALPDGRVSAELSEKFQRPVRILRLKSRIVAVRVGGVDDAAEEAPGVCDAGRSGVEGLEMLVVRNLLPKFNRHRRPLVRAGVVRL